MIPSYYVEAGGRERLSRELAIFHEDLMKIVAVRPITRWRKFWNRLVLWIWRGCL